MSFFSSICSIRTPCCNLRLQQYRNKDQCMLSKIQVTTITISKIAFNNNENDTGGGGGGGARLDDNSAWYLFCILMIHRFMTSHPVAKLLLCFGAKHSNGHPMQFGFHVLHPQANGTLYLEY